jgi:hypothetical protein
MTKDEALRLALEALTVLLDEWTPARQAQLKGMDAITAIKAALEAKDEQHGSPCPEFWDWLPKAYRDGDFGAEPRFTKYNMEVAFLAGKQSAALEEKNETAQQRINKLPPNDSFERDEAARNIVREFMRNH